MMKSTETKQVTSKIHKYEWLIQEQGHYDKPVRIIADDFLTVKNKNIEKHVLVAGFVDGFGERFTCVDPSILRKINNFEKLKPDTLIWVRGFNKSETYQPRYFSHCNGDMVYFFTNGFTSEVVKHLVCNTSELISCVNYLYCLTDEDYRLKTFVEENKTVDYTKQDPSKIHEYDWMIDGFDKPFRILCTNLIRENEQVDFEVLTVVAHFDDVFCDERAKVVKPSSLKKINKLNKFSKLKQDDKIWVTFDLNKPYYAPRHFSHCEGDMVYFFADGYTSFTAEYFCGAHGNKMCLHKDNCLTDDEMKSRKGNK